MQPSPAQPYWYAAALTLFLCGALTLSAQEPLAIGNRRQLLMDETFVQQSKAIQLVVHSPQKTGDQIVVSEPGLARENCDLVHTANEINRVVKWNGASSVNDLAGKPVRLHFVMRGVDLYAFQFAERGGI